MKSKCKVLFCIALIGLIFCPKSDAGLFGLFGKSSDTNSGPSLLKGRINFRDGRVGDFEVPREWIDFGRDAADAAIATKYPMFLPYVKDIGDYFFGARTGAAAAPAGQFIPYVYFTNISVSTLTPQDSIYIPGTNIDTIIVKEFRRLDYPAASNEVVRTRAFSAGEFASMALDDLKTPTLAVSNLVNLVIGAGSTNTATSDENGDVNLGTILLPAAKLAVPE